MRRTLAALLALVFLVLTAPASTQGPPADRVILITLDGARIEEMFGGLDPEVFTSTLGKGQTLEDQRAYRRFWADTPQARREKLMPFFWRTLMARHGSIAGNKARGELRHA